MLMVNLMIILFHLKSDKFYCIRAMNYLKEIFQQFLFIKKWVSYYWFNIQELLHKAKDRYQNCGGKEKVPKYYFGNKDFTKEKENNK